MIDIKNLPPRIDIEKASEIIAFCKGKAGQKVSKKTVYTWINKGRFPKRMDLPYGTSVWDTNEVLTALGLIDKS